MAESTQRALDELPVARKICPLVGAVYSDNNRLGVPGVIRRTELHETSGTLGKTGLNSPQTLSTQRPSQGARNWMGEQACWLDSL